MDVNGLSERKIAVTIVGWPLAKLPFPPLAQRSRGAPRTLPSIEAEVEARQLGDTEPPRLCRRPQLVRSRVYDKQNDEQIFS